MVWKVLGGYRRVLEGRVGSGRVQEVIGGSSSGGSEGSWRTLEGQKGSGRVQKGLGGSRVLVGFGTFKEGP